MNSKQWKLLKRSGGYRRRIRKVYENIKNNSIITKQSDETSDQEIFRNTIEESQIDESSSSSTKMDAGSVDVINSLISVQYDNEDRYNFADSNTDDEQISELLAKQEKKCDFRNQFRNWALNHNVNHKALKDLISILNDRLPDGLPTDPRTLLNTPRAISTTKVDPGDYWHNCLKKCLVSHLDKIADTPQNISLIINIDGLPIHKNSKQQFWPILCSIYEKPEIRPMICGIYLGSAKPKDLDAFFKEFLKDMHDILQNGVEINDQKIKVTVKCFVCDSPARAMVKGTCNFNGKHGCLKCTIVGEYSHVSHTVVFPSINCPLRNDKDFREKKYGKHHKYDSPLLKLPIDMIEAFPVADSLHLIDLGIMKRLLIGWRDGNFGKKDTKWRASDIDTVNHFLKSCKTPIEIHRSVRGLDCLSHWKGSEFRTFFYYLSIVILPKVLKQEAVHHFLTLYCAITICSTEVHFYLLSLAQELLNFFVTNFKKYYGFDYVTSNVHNLIHIVDEVKNFGKLDNFNAYKFENKLYLIKNLLRQGNKPLAQVAKRLGELENIVNERNSNLSNADYPYVKKNYKNNRVDLHFQDFTLSTKKEDKYFLTHKKEIMEISSFNIQENKIKIYCRKIEHVQNVFDLPIYSSYLNIFKASENLGLITEFECSPGDVKSKLVVTIYDSELYFVPMLHTLNK